MSNIDNSKEEVLLQAVRKLLVDDNADTGKTVREIDYYVGDRIYLTDKNIDNATFPQIILSVDAAEDELGLPTGNYVLDVRTYVNIDDEYAKTKLKRIDARVLVLINKRSDSLNSAVTGKNLRCRLIVKMSSLETTDPIAHLYIKRTSYRVILDDEVID